MPRNKTDEAAAAGAGAADAKNNRKKRSSPFRIKVGCVASLRHQTQGNNVSIVQNDGMAQPLQWPSSKFARVWTSPLVGRDEGLALIGKRIRCFIPKVQEHQTRRVLEGEIISLLDYHHQSNNKQRRPAAAAASGAGKTPTKVELLVQQSHAAEFPFIQQILPQTLDTTTLSKSARRNRKLEETIRGSNMVSLKVKLANVRCMNDTTATTGATVKNKNCVPWVIETLIPLQLFSTNDVGTNKSQEQALPMPPPAPTKRKYKKRNDNKRERATSRYVGNGNDTPEQQIANWRWLCGRYHDVGVYNNLLMQSHELLSLVDYWTKLLTAGFVGKVLRVQPQDKDSSGTTLALVTLQRLVLPEHTASGRMTHHGMYDLFDDKDVTDSQNNVTIQVPIEQLVVVGRTLEKEQLDDASMGEASLDRMSISLSYSLLKDLYFRIPRSDEQIATQTDELKLFCHRCRRVVSYDEGALQCIAADCRLKGTSGSNEHLIWCQKCFMDLKVGCTKKSESGSEMPCCLGICDCRQCLIYAGTALHEELRFLAAQSALASSARRDTPFSTSVAFVQSIRMVDFGLPSNFIDYSSLSKPYAQPSTRIKVRALKKAPRIPAKPGRKPKQTPDDAILCTLNPIVDYSVFQASCARHVAYNLLRKQGNAGAYSPSVPATSSDRPRNLRQGIHEERKLPGTEEKHQSRAARVNQRRLLKDVAAIGSLGVDTLTNRESQIRFDRSGIHAWGVFADVDISGDEMIVEYRGEIIGNAVCEKREKQYDDEKIGSDYMFRIDSETVCDATKQGNVARFINASCDPNCYTKIINLGGVKRIVIYSKRDIHAGEELVYDYKFSLEYDESKRVPCHCGTASCRGYMNWDKRYVVVPSPSGCGQTEEKRHIESDDGTRTTESDNQNGKMHTLVMENDNAQSLSRLHALNNNQLDGDEVYNDHSSKLDDGDHLNSLDGSEELSDMRLEDGRDDSFDNFSDDGSFLELNSSEFVKQRRRIKNASVTGDICKDEKRLNDEFRDGRERKRIKFTPPSVRLKQVEL